MSRIVLVEDNEKNMKLARDLLAYNGHTVFEAVTGEAAVTMTIKEIPDLVLMDIQLPGIDGIEALRQIRADGKATRIPIVALTASVMTNDRERFDKAGFDGFIAKPIDIKSFAKDVAALIAKGRA